MLSIEKMIPPSVQDPTNASPVKRHHHRHNVKSRYEFIKTLGKGTYGKVKLARHKETNKLVAVKAIKKDKIKDTTDMKHIRREMEIMSSIRHPHIIQIYEVFENQDKIVIVMEYAPGGELYDHLADKHLISQEDAKSFFRQIISAVRYCHQRGIVHRDLKLENILLDKDNCIKIADFGLANFFKSDSLLDTFCGSPLYASPEIVCGVKYKGPEVDSWSLGVLLFALVYGTMPFDGRNYQILTKQITSGAISKPPKPSDAHDLISWMLKVDPKSRATIDDIASHKWVKGVTDLTQLTPTVTQDTTNDSFHLGHGVDINRHVELDLDATLKAEDKEEISLINQPKGILKNNPAPVKEPQRKRPDIDKTFEGQLAAVCGLNAKDSLKLKAKPKSASGKRRVLRPRRDRESGYYSSPERIPAINEKVNSSDPTLHPNIHSSVPLIKSSLATGRLSRLPTKQHPSVSQAASLPVGTSKDPYMVPMAPPADERLVSISSDDGSSVGSRTRPTSTYSDSSILSSDSFDLCAFENSTTHRSSVAQSITISNSVQHQQRPFSISLIPDTLPPLDPSSVEEQPTGSLTPNSEKLVRDLQRILAPNKRRTQSGQNRTTPQNHTKRPHSVNDTSQLSEMMNQLNIDLDLAYRKASHDICANLGPSEI